MIAQPASAPTERMTLGTVYAVSSVTQRRQDGLVGSTEDAFEAASKRVLQRLLGGEVVDRDIDGAQNTRDFDLVVDDTVAHAVEVTSVQLPTARATLAGIERLRHKDLGLTAAWDVYIHEEAPTRPIERNAPRLLNLLHASGVLSLTISILRPT